MRIPLKETTSWMVYEGHSISHSLLLFVDFTKVLPPVGPFFRNRLILFHVQKWMPSPALTASCANPWFVLGCFLLLLKV